MKKRGKKYINAKEKIDTHKFFMLEEALHLLKEISYTKFDPTVESAFRLGVNPKYADQMVRGSVVLPHGIGKEVRVLVFAKHEKEKEAREAGADFVGGEELIQKISEGWLEFDKTVATPDMMGLVGKIGKILGPRGLMPNPKVGTVTFDVARAVREIKAGKIEFKVEKAGIVHAPFGKISFGVEKLKENFLVLLEAILRAKPATSKGTYLKGISLSTTMSPGIKLDTLHLQSLIK